MSYQTPTFSAIHSAASYLLKSSSNPPDDSRLTSHLTSAPDSSAIKLNYTSDDRFTAVSEFLALSILLQRVLKLSTFGGRYVNSSVIYAEKGWGYKLARKLGMTARRSNESDGLARELKEYLRRQNKSLRSELQDAIKRGESIKRKLQKGKYSYGRDDVNWALVKAEVAYEMERLRMIAFTESEALFIIRLDNILTRYTALRQAFSIVKAELG